MSTKIIYASAARTATPTAIDMQNAGGHVGMQLIIDCTAIVTAPSVTFVVEALDVASGKYYTILTSAAIVGTGTTVLRIHPSLTVAANVTAKDSMPLNFRVTATHANANSITYSVGANMIN